MAFTDDVPAGTSVVSGSVTCSDPAAVVASENPVTVDNISLDIGATVTVSFNVTVDLDTPIDTHLINQSKVTWMSMDTWSNATDTLASSSTWYLAEGCTLDGFETWVLVENPGDTPAKINMAFDTDSGEVVLPELQNLTVPAHTRSSWNLANYIQTYDVATRVSSDSEMVCERAMYGNERAWATCSVGTQSVRHLVPAGGLHRAASRAGSWCRTPTTMRCTSTSPWIPRLGLVPSARMQDLIMPAHTRASWNLADYYTSYDVATVLTSEGRPGSGRALHVRSGPHLGRHNSIGTPATSDSEWFLAEGCTVGMETWILVQNPNGVQVEVDLSYLTENGVVVGAAGRGHRRLRPSLLQRR